MKGHILYYECSFVSFPEHQVHLKRVVVGERESRELLFSSYRLLVYKIEICGLLRWLIG